MKAREDRQKVMIRARMRSASDWHDVCVLNLSLHGLGIQSAAPPARGAYVEIRRGHQTVIARVAWNKGHRAGLRSQDPIFIAGLIDDRREEPAPTANGNFQGMERRRVPRPPAQAHDHSRLKARAFEFVCFAGIAGAVAFGIFSSVSETLSAPLVQVRAALDLKPLPEEQGQAAE